MPNRKAPPRSAPPPDPAVVSTSLRESAAALGVRLDPETADRLVAFGRELLRWNARVDLVAPTDLATFASRHLLDALALLPLLRDLGVRRLIDLGSGAGLPGLVLALVEPGLTVESLEPRGRRAAFQRHVSRLLGLGGVRVTERRVEPGRLPPVPPADAVVARAVAPLPDLLALAAPLARPGGV
ncbi:MAG TPA: RsmG family class I SAM-dependent methyltransferase, partial [Thermodesulfobacteriota bacterium]